MTIVLKKMIGQIFSNNVIFVQEKLNCKVFNTIFCTELYHAKGRYITITLLIHHLTKCIMV